MEVTLTPLHKNIQHLTNEEQLMVKLVVPKEFKDVQSLPPKHLCFILDTSGSLSTIKAIRKPYFPGCRCNFSDFDPVPPMTKPLFRMASNTKV